MMRHTFPFLDPRFAVLRDADEPRRDVFANTVENISPQSRRIGGTPALREPTSPARRDSVALPVHSVKTASAVQPLRSESGELPMTEADATFDFGAVFGASCDAAGVDDFCVCAAFPGGWVALVSQVLRSSSRRPRT